MGSVLKIDKIASNKSIDERISEIAGLVMSIIFLRTNQVSAVNDLGKRLLRLAGIGKISGVRILGPREFSYKLSNRRETHTKSDVVVELRRG